MAVEHAERLRGSRAKHLRAAAAYLEARVIELDQAACLRQVARAHNASAGNLSQAVRDEMTAIAQDPRCKRFKKFFTPD